MNGSSLTHPAFFPPEFRADPSCQTTCSMWKFQSYHLKNAAIITLTTSTMVCCVQDAMKEAETLAR